ncbi:MAG: hypothetical protein Q4C65_14040 [Eubacteriales bacterium]|nr:hypothetical protein [Eubacteriales bacterium]
MGQKEQMTESGEELRREQTRRETDRKCPDCGATMDFDPDTGGLACPYCGHREQIGEGEQSGEEAASGAAEAAGPAGGRRDSAPELDFDSAPDDAACEWGAHKKVVVCKACGAESVYDELELANECPYCGSNQVMEEKGERTLAPGGVVPFRLTEREAAGKFSSWLRRRLLCPRTAKQSARPGAFKGVYLPYWTFDTQAAGEYEAEYGIDRQVDTREGRRTETEWHHTKGSCSRRIDDQLVLASSRYAPGLMCKVEPFQTSLNKTYRPEYVAGFIAERYSVPLKEGWERAREQIGRQMEGQAETEVRRRYSADHVRIRKLHLDCRDVTYKYLLLPVWLSSYRYRDKVYHFMVNGQSGKAGGEAPVSSMRVAILIVLAAAAFLLCSDYWQWTWIPVLLAAVLALVCRLKNL